MFSRNDPTIDPRLKLAIENQNADEVRSLIANGVNVNFGKGLTPIELASSLGLTEIVRILLDAGANPNCGFQYPLDIAASEGHVEVVRELINAGADVSVALEDNDSILINASTFGHYEVVRLLIDAGADVNHVSDQDDYALYMAAVNDHQDIVDLLTPLCSQYILARFEQDMSD
jgi:uncharacterized protein